MKNQNIISIDAEKAFEKIQHSFMTKKSLNKVGIEGTYLSVTKTNCDKATTSIIISTEK